jgi:hypothetical protein
MNRSLPLALLSTLLLLPTTTTFAAPQFTEIIGSRAPDPAEKAAESYSRGAKSLRKAEGETDPEKKKKLLMRAKEDLNRSVAYRANYDALLALGQAYLGLDAPDAARDACNRALGLKPNDEKAQDCFERASQQVLAAKKAQPAPNGGQ